MASENDDPMELDGGAPAERTAGAVSPNGLRLRPRRWRCGRRAVGTTRPDLARAGCDAAPRRDGGSSLTSMPADTG
eukprot:2030313-Prymnesium_polylepis.1